MSKLSDSARGALLAFMRGEGGGLRQLAALLSGFTPEQQAEARELIDTFAAEREAQKRRLKEMPLKGGVNCNQLMRWIAEADTINAARLALSIRLADEAAEGLPCSGCGAPVDVRPGPVLCVGSAASPVCDSCGWQLAPALVELRRRDVAARLSSP